jgi:hypothetical protein
LNDRVRRIVLDLVHVGRWKNGLQHFGNLIEHPYWQEAFHEALNRGYTVLLQSYVRVYFANLSVQV